MKNMILNIFNPDKTVARTVRIIAHNEVWNELTRAYYELGLIRPDYEVLQG